MIRIPVNEPLLTNQELEYVSECVRTGSVSSAGRFIEEFEENWATYCGRLYGIAVSNGTVALQVAAACLDPNLAEKARSLRNLCFQADRRFLHEELGFNFRLTNMQAALGLAQLERIEEIIARKRWIGQEYNRRVAGIKGLQLPIEEPWARNVYWMYGVVLSEENGVDATVFAQRLKQQGIETRPFFLGLHEQPVFHRFGLQRQVDSYLEWYGRILNADRRRLQSASAAPLDTIAGI